MGESKGRNNLSEDSNFDMKIRWLIGAAFIIILAGMSGACTGKSSQATKAANESDVTEREGSGKEAEKNPENTVEKRPYVGILFPSQEDDTRWLKDEKELCGALADARYDAQVLYADSDPVLQAEQIQSLIRSGASALLLAPADVYSLGDVLADAEKQDIPVFCYDSLVMNTDAVNYYFTFDTRKIGRQIGEEIISRTGLQTEGETSENSSVHTIEFLMGSPEDTGQLFLFNGIMEVLRPYLENGTLECRSQRLDYSQVSIRETSTDTAMYRLEELVSGYYETEQAPDILVTASDSYAQRAADFFTLKGLTPDHDVWPVITGLGAEANTVRSVEEGKIAFTVFEDNRELARMAAKSMEEFLSGEEPEVSDYGQYDNGVKLVRAVTAEAQIIDRDNYRLLVDNGYYEERVLTADTFSPAQKQEETDFVFGNEGTESTKSSSENS